MRWYIPRFRPTFFVAVGIFHLFCMSLFLDGRRSRVRRHRSLCLIIDHRFRKRPAVVDIMAPCHPGLPSFREICNQHCEHWSSSRWLYSAVGWKVPDACMYLHFFALPRGKSDTLKGFIARPFKYQSFKVSRQSVFPRGGGRFTVPFLARCNKPYTYTALSQSKHNRHHIPLIPNPESSADMTGTLRKKIW